METKSLAPMENSSKRTFSFDKEGVIINIPTQTSGIPVVPHLLDLVWHSEMRIRENFNPNRLVINVEFVDERDPGVYLEEFDPPIEMQVYYTLGDRSFAEKDEKPLSIAYWKDGQWKVISKSDPHRLSDISPILSSGWTGLLRFDITYWGEPSIALGS